MKTAVIWSSSNLCATFPERPAPAEAACRTCSVRRTLTNVRWLAAAHNGLSSVSRLRRVASREHNHASTMKKTILLTAKLVLHKETIKTLVNADLSRVVAGIDETACVGGGTSHGGSSCPKFDAVVVKL